jgi:hypothetical protein
MDNLNVKDTLISKIWAHMAQFENKGIGPKEIMKNYYFWRNLFSQEIVEQAVLKKWPFFTDLLEWYAIRYDSMKDYSPFKNLPMR